MQWCKAMRRWMRRIHVAKEPQSYKAYSSIWFECRYVDDCVGVCECAFYIMCGDYVVLTFAVTCNLFGIGSSENQICRSKLY